MSSFFKWNSTLTSLIYEQRGVFSYENHLFHTYVTDMDQNQHVSESDKLEKYQKLKETVGRILWTKARVVPLIIGALGAVTPKPENDFNRHLSPEECNLSNSWDTRLDPLVKRLRETGEWRDCVCITYCITYMFIPRILILNGWHVCFVLCISLFQSLKLSTMILTSKSLPH